MVARSGDKRRRAQQRRSHVRGRLLGVVYGVEMLAIFGDAAEAIHNITGNKDEVGFLKGGAVGHRALRWRAGRAVSKQDQVVGLIERFTRGGGGFKNRLARLQYAIMKLLARREAREMRAINQVRRDAGYGDSMRRGGFSGPPICGARVPNLYLPIGRSVGGLPHQNQTLR